VARPHEFDDRNFMLMKPTRGTRFFGLDCTLPCAVCDWHGSPRCLPPSAARGRRALLLTTPALQVLVDLTSEPDWHAINLDHLDQHQTPANTAVPVIDH
jgi:hypothetical protein